MFSQVCVKNSVHRGVCMVGACMAWGMCGRGGHGRGACMAGGHAWQGACVVGGGCVVGMCMVGGVHDRGGVHGRRDGHCSGRYASYWNAFLFDIITLM